MQFGRKKKRILYILFYQKSSNNQLDKEIVTNTQTYITRKSVRDQYVNPVFHAQRCNNVTRTRSPAAPMRLAPARHRLHGAFARSDARIRRRGHTRARTRRER